MANTKQALKRVRQTAKRAAANRRLRNRVKVARRTIEEAIEAGETAKAKETLPELFSAVDKCAKANIYHKNKAANLKSKTIARINKAVA